jgi:hypothetical protein
MQANVYTFQRHDFHYRNKPEGNFQLLLLVNSTEKKKIKNKEGK